MAGSEVQQALGGVVTTRHALRRGRCKVFALDAEAATGLALHKDYTPCDWEHNQFAAESQLDRLIKQGRHPWLVNDPRAADVVVITNHNFARWCVVSTVLRNRALEDQRGWHKNELRGQQRSVDGGNLCGGATAEACGAPHSDACKRSGRLFRSESAKRRLWEQIHRAADLLNTSVPRVIVHLNNECPPAWGPGAGPSRVGGGYDGRPRTLMLVDRTRRPQDGTVPFVLSRPPWLVGSAPPPSELQPAIPWHQRPLVLFAGHVPKLYLSPTRYLLWRAWRRDPRVSVYTKDIACSLRAHSICQHPDRWAADHATFCQADCQTARSCKGSAAAVRRECLAYRRVDWDGELPDVPRTNRGLSRPAYLREAMRHRFCVVAPGDFPSTPKMTEFVAIGAAGGWCAA